MLGGWSVPVFEKHEDKFGKLKIWEEWVMDYVNGWSISSPENEDVNLGQGFLLVPCDEWSPTKLGLAPMFSVYNNDMVDGVFSYVSLFADKAKLLSHVNNVKDYDALQGNHNRIWEW